ncbi:MAG: putative selenate reductase subunit YgfK [Caldisericaceae bacterium]|nr:putative selenate reductase subunit YgfK [Caldisericaceae bacterium]
MSDLMRPISFSNLMQWILDEWQGKGSIFDYPLPKIFIKKPDHQHPFLDGKLETPLGPAAGPHTQMTQNIVTAYLAGGRFFELKTVQKLDQLEIPRPCIEAQDEGYNVEWSQELRLEQSLDEYIKAYFALHFLKTLLPTAVRGEGGFIFNMSVGYDLEGIQTPRMDYFINSLHNGGGEGQFETYRRFMLDWLQNQHVQRKIKDLMFLRSDFKVDHLFTTFENLSPEISASVTVSTMHGCPPQEIEAICRYLLQEKKLHTYVKLNPTLLGYAQVREILHELGYGYMELDPVSFEHDLQYREAVPMIRRLQQLAQQQGRVFGIKLSNTLGVKNVLGRLPGEEMYLSGRALFPLTIHLAQKLAHDLQGNIQISFSGGASMHNVQEILECGIFPVTMVTDLLKPGGYQRLQQMAVEIDGLPWESWLKGEVINLSKLDALAQKSLKDEYYRKARRQVDSIKINKSLPLFDCYLAPCKEACPIHQDVSAYIRLVEERRYLDALQVILETNPLPHITGYICDHQCMFHCTRWDYEDPVYIREMKKVAAEQAWNSFLEKFGSQLKPEKTNGIKVAVVGAGPAGLSAAYFLARAGFEVTVLEKEQQAGGVVRNVIPDFRLPQYALDRDVDLIRRHGVQFQFGVKNVTIEQLRAQGFKYIFLAIGAGKSRSLHLQPAHGLALDALEFLRAFKQNKPVQLGRRVAVIGGGNSAMDAARAALRIDGVEKVYIIYRRTEQYMPADREEFDAALQEGVVFKELLLPVAFEEGRLTCQKMALAEVGPDGRRTVKPIPDAFETLEIDAVISAIGEQVDEQFLKENGIVLDLKSKEQVLVETNLPGVFIGGDALRGPSTVVESIADGKQVAELIMKREKASASTNFPSKIKIDTVQLNWDLIIRKGQIVPLNNEATAEAARCLSCDFVCDKCVEVCPNRANVTLFVGSHGKFKDVTQILHLDGLCNECGNCETFCPYQGKPYKDKITLFWSKEDFENSANDGFFIEKEDERLHFRVRFQGESDRVIFNENGELQSETLFRQKEAFPLLQKMIQSLVKNHRYLLNFK